MASPLCGSWPSANRAIRISIEAPPGTLSDRKGAPHGRPFVVHASGQPGLALVAALTATALTATALTAAAAVATAAGPTVATIAGAIGATVAVGTIVMTDIFAIRIVDAIIVADIVPIRVVDAIIVADIVPIRIVDAVVVGRVVSCRIVETRNITGGVGLFADHAVGRQCQRCQSHGQRQKPRLAQERRPSVAQVEC